MTVLAWINNQTMVCENTSVDPRPASEVHIDGYIMLDLEQTPSAHWEWDEITQNWEIVEEGIGFGGVGDEYINEMLVTPKPNNTGNIITLDVAANQPNVSGTQTL